MTSTEPISPRPSGVPTVGELLADSVLVAAAALVVAEVPRVVA